MASTLRVTSVSSFTQEYLARNSETINDIAQRLGVSATAIAAAVAEEMRNVYTTAPVYDVEGNAVLDGQGNVVHVPVKSFFDMVLDQNVSTFTHDQIAADFLARLSDILNGNPPSYFEKIGSPTANDIGPANTTCAKSCGGYDCCCAFGECCCQLSVGNCC